MNWPDNLPEYIIENPIQYLLHEEIDYSENVLGNLWLERNTYGLIQGTSGLGKSMVAVQIGVEAALGRSVFGLRVDKPLRVLIVQAEDSKNDRILQTTCIHRLAVTTEERLLISQNLRIVTPRKRAHRGKALFDFLTDNFQDSAFDLFILNPALAFLDGDVNSTESVGEFLRSQLQEFLRLKNAAGIVIHHTPKPPKSGKGRAADTTMYSAHGSAEWTNAPRASITIERTKVPYVFEFTIGKRGACSGWEINREGSYVKYFTHSRSRNWFWSPATDSDIAAAMSGISADDFSQVFHADADLTFEVIKKRFKHFGYNYSNEELGEILDELVEKGKLNTVEVDGETVWRPIKSAKAVAKGATLDARTETTFLVIEEAGAAGIIVTAIRQRVPFGASVLAQCLDRLLALGRVRIQLESTRTRRYFATEDALVVVQT